MSAPSWSLLLAGLVAVCPPEVGAQEPRMNPASDATIGSVRGEVFDSLIGRPLGGAHVRVRGTALGATTDRRGHFRLDSVPAGRRVLVLDHPSLDSAGLSDLPWPVEVVDGQTTQAILTVPSLHTFAMRACRALISGDSGIVFGAVRDATTGVRLSGARVTVSWVRVERDRKPVRITRPVREVLTDTLGSYYVCGLPTVAQLNAQAGAGPYASGELDLAVGARRVLRHDFTVSRDAGADTAAQGPRHGAAALVGTVTDETGRPLDAVLASVPFAANDAISDRSGRFLLTGLPAGSQMLYVRRVGYRFTAVPVDLRDHDTTAVSLQLEMFSILDTLKVTATGWVRSEIDELQRRLRLHSASRVRTAEALAGAGSIGTVFYDFPSMTVRTGVSGTYLEMRRGTRACVPKVWIDGWPMNIEVLDLYRPSDLVALEVYPPSEVPVRYADAWSSCGVVLAWTRYLQ
jgi:hypothetical protein